MGTTQLSLNADPFFVGLAVTGMVILGFISYFHNRQSITAKILLLFALVSSAWGVVNYLQYQFADPRIAIWLIRLVMFFAAWQAFTFFLMAYVFPKPTVKIPSYFRNIFLPLVVIVSILTLTPYVFSYISGINSETGVSVAIPGPAIGIFGIVSVGFVIAGIVRLIRRFIQVKGEEKYQYYYFFLGTWVMFALIIPFNFILAAFLSDLRFVPFGAVWVFPFILFTTYAIFKHHLLNIKVIGTEVLAGFLSIASLVELILSHNGFEILLRASVFILVLVFGVLLIRSVLKEVHQREELQVLSSKLKDANFKLKDLDRARAEFINIASHQLRTPPATIKWYLSAILSGDFGNLDPELKDALVKTQLTNNELMSLIEDMLNASRIERGTMEFEFNPVNMVEVIDAGIAELTPQARLKNLSLEFKRPKKSIPVVTADREKVAQVVNNFIDNAIKYTKKGGIKIDIDTDKKWVTVKVTDSGKGIDKEGLGFVFEKYKRGGDSSKYSKGLGLGLYVAKIIVEQHHGKIWAESQGEGKGSAFIFQLPINSDIYEQKTSLDLRGHSNREEMAKTTS